MKVKLTTDRKHSHDGYSEVIYMKDHVYTSGYAKETHYFEHLVDIGYAVVVEDEKVVEKHPAKKAFNKVITPKHKK